MISLGLKVFSTNAQYVEPALELFRSGLIQYIEIYAYPGSLTEAAVTWALPEVPKIVHAPHFKDGLNFAQREKRDFNLTLARETLDFAGRIEAPIVIFHPGVNGRIEETAEQVKLLRDPRILIENKPAVGNGENLNCNGASFEELSFVLSATGAGFCLDMGHAICAANTYQTDPIEFIEKLNTLKPVMYHMTDGNYQSPFDRHDHYGQGSFPLERIFPLIPDGYRVTNEAVKDYPDRLDDVAEDAKYLRALEQKVRTSL